ncbi:MAG: metallophosphoesterase family protein [Planctomycetota bacterium]|jgi:putative phosphoesterase
MTSEPDPNAPDGVSSDADETPESIVYDAVYGDPSRLVRVGLISDTHIPDKASSIPGTVLEAFEGVDVILHGGDLISLSVLKILGRIAPVEAVSGNNDPKQVANKVPTRRLLKIGGAAVGLVHGHRGRGRNTPDRAVKSFREPLQALVFGHSHLPLIIPAGQPDPYRYREEPLPFILINPGSPTDRRHAPRKSYGMMEIKGSEVTAELIWL